MTILVFCLIFSLSRLLFGAMTMYCSLTGLEFAQRVEAEGLWSNIPVSVLEETVNSARSIIEGGVSAGWMGGSSTENGGLDAGLNDDGVMRLWEEIGDPAKWPQARIERNQVRVGDTVMLIGVGAESNVYRLLRVHG